MSDKIKKVSNAFRVFFCVVFVAVLLYFIAAWSVAPGVFRVGTSHINFVLDAIPNNLTILSPITVGTQLLAMLVAALPLALYLWLIGILIRLFSAFAQSEIFSLKNVKRIRNIGWVLLAVEIVHPISQALISLILTWHNPVGYRMVETSVNGVNISLIVVALLVVLISWVFGEGYKLQEEHEYTI